MLRRGFRRTVVGGLILSVCGCATIEFKEPPEVPEVRVMPKEAAAPNTSPPPLPPEVQPPAQEAPAAQPTLEPLNLTVEQAIEMALNNNQGLQAEKIDPASARTLIAEAKSVFDPALTASVSERQQRVEHDLRVPVPVTVPDGEGGTVAVGNTVREVETTTETETLSGTVGVDEFLPTGTTISATVSPSRIGLDNSASRRGFDRGSDTDVDATTAQLSFTQSLLRGAGLKVNLVGIRQAKLQALSSDYELRAFVESLVAQVENTYWDYSLAKKQIQILEDSLKLAEEQQTEVEERIRVGVLAETERAAADAEVAQRRSQLIDGKSSLAQLRLAFLRLLNPSPESLRGQEVLLVSDPVMPEIDMNNVEESILFAYRMRPELNQTRLQIEQNDLDLVKTRNGLLPQLDLFLDLSKDLTRTEYADLILTSSQDVEDDSYRLDVGAQFSYPIGNRAARARYQRAEFARDKSEEALANLTQLVEQDVRGAYVELERAREQVSATAATRRLQEVVAQTEREKFRIGTSTGILVAQAQRDMLAAQINEVQAVKNFLKAIVNLYRLDGSLLLRRAIMCPGAQPVES